MKRRRTDNMKNKTPASSRVPPVSSRVPPPEKRRRQEITPSSFEFPASPDTAQPSQQQAKSQQPQPTKSQPEAYKFPLVVASFLPKGGVAKTTTALGLAGIFAGQGKRILLADCDSQCSTTDFMVETFEDGKRAEELLQLRRDRLQELLGQGAFSFLYVRKQ